VRQGREKRKGASEREGTVHKLSGPIASQMNVSAQQQREALERANFIEGGVYSKEPGEAKKCRLVWGQIDQEKGRCNIQWDFGNLKTTRKRISRFRSFNGQKNPERAEQAIPVTKGLNGRAGGD